jgi:hypothetical protein
VTGVLGLLYPILVFSSVLEQLKLRLRALGVAVTCDVMACRAAV